MAKQKNIKYKRGNVLKDGDTLNTIAGAVGGLGSLAIQGMNNLKVPEMEARQMNGISSNADLMSYINNYNPQEVERLSVGESIIGGITSGVSAGAATANPWAMGAGALLGGLTGGITAGIGNKKRAALEADLKAQESSRFASTVNAVQGQNQLTALANYQALGGPLSNGFTNGANWTNGLTTINNGGTHQENPFGGVMMGMDQEGVPNLVEEGEVKWNDYIFSKRSKAREKDLEKAGLPKKYANMPFADIANALNKEGVERPNDPISENGLDAALSKLAMIQEARKPKQKEGQANQFTPGGPLPTETKPLPTWTRYAPIVGSGLGVLTDLMGITNKPDYSNAEKVENSISNLSTVTPSKVGNYLTYTPFDRNYYLNKLGSETAGNRAAMLDMAGGNRATAMAGVLASDFNATKAAGDLAREGEEFNLDQRIKTEDFNSRINMFNSQQAMQAAQINKQNEEMRFRSALAAAEMREKQDQLSSAGRSANLTNLFDSLGGIGTENFFKNQRNWEIKKGLHGSGHAFGGKIKTRKRGLTY